MVPAMSEAMVPAQLIDGSAPATPDDLFARLESLGIEARTMEHAPVFTVEEAKARRGELPGAHIKNLFLCNKKRAMWLVVCLEDRQVDLKVLAGALEAGRFSFGSADRLMKYLGIEPGAVTPFAVINDRQRAVQVVLDKAMLDHNPINGHPLVNHMTTAVAPEDLVGFLEAEGHPPQMLDLDGL